MKHWHLSLLAIAFLGCGGPGRFMRGGAQVGALAVREVAWNPAHVEVGHVAAVADSGEDVVVLGDLGAQFFTGGAMTGQDRRIVTWRAAGTLPSADRTATWLAALDGTGTLHRVRARASLEPISDRYGLSGKAITSFAPLGEGWITFALAKSGVAAPMNGLVAAPAGGLLASSGVTAPAGGLLALADGHTVTTFAAAKGGPVSGGGGKVAWLETGAVHVFEPRRGGSVLFPLAGATRAALDERGRLFATTEHEVYAEDATGTLALVYETASEAISITGLVASGGRVWFSEGGDLGTIEGGDLGVIKGARVAVTTALARPRTALIAASSSGDVWSLSGGTLARFTVATKVPAGAPGAPDPGKNLSEVEAGDGLPPGSAGPWPDVIAQIFARSCASCHGASPSSGIDLSTEGAWRRRRPLLRRRVLVDRDMPPRGHTLDASDREAIDAWTAPAGR